MERVNPETGEVSAVAAVYPEAIAKAIAQVMGADLYVQKRGKNQFHGYKYATVGDLLDKLQPLMAEAGLVIFQHELATEFIDGGNVMATRYQFTLAHTSGAVWPEKPIHTGMSACRNSKGGFDDKAANKCHTAARKYFLLGLFQVPTGEDFREAAHHDDADAGDDAPPNSEAAERKLPASSKRTAAPPADDTTQEARAAFTGLKKAIQAAPHMQALDSLMKTPETNRKLALIKEQSATGYEQLMELVATRERAMAEAA